MAAGDVLIKRVNGLFHELTQDSFDAQHRHRHRAERAFWTRVGQLIGRRLRGQFAGGRQARRLVVADIGCGTGFVTGVVGSELRPGDTIIAIDVAEAALKSTVNRWNKLLPGRGSTGGPRLVCTASDAQTLPLADAGLDCVLMNAALHHLPSPRDTLAEIDRVLRPGGLFALGFEPNRGHFESVAMRNLARSLDRASWYASVDQNCRRFRQWLGVGMHEVGSGGEQRLLEAINARLLEEHLLGSPLTFEQILDLVDPHARGAGLEAGFDPADLLRRVFPQYEVLSLSSSDYLGESARKAPLLRGVADRMLGVLAPQRGLLFSWVIRKPAGTEGTEAGSLNGTLCQQQNH
jgi:SAM-dependent methyltransferase